MDKIDVPRAACFGVAKSDVEESAASGGVGLGVHTSAIGGYRAKY